MREICQSLASTLFSNDEPANVEVIPYEVMDNGSEATRHELLAWNEGDATLVRVKIFNLVTYLVRLPFVELQPTRYRQDTRTGIKVISATLAPHLIVDASLATPDGYRKEFARRVDAVVAIGSCKSDIVSILDDVLGSSAYRMAIGSEARARILENKLRERFQPRAGVFEPWVAREIVTFGKRRISEMSKI